ncbi:hypothetical protein U27_06682 [Candidatus Vecturithrix granuli]|uniref:DUF5615 domain-containing protein n=1 Tax=Vecturithrix granuli TaxID=1499967 RepID=A0A081C542_VECG1|nr:hypothetical protein U27_06682 [Candidatus Vecturithrix granuli]
MKKLYLDEDVPEAIAVALRLRGCDVLTVKEAERKGFSDVEQLNYAFSIGRILLTHNIADFCKIHTTFMRNGEPHHGIILSKQLPIGLRSCFKSPCNGHFERGEQECQSSALTAKAELSHSSLANF